MLHATMRNMICGAVEPNQSLANAAVCDLPPGHDDWHEGFAQGPAAAERPGRHRWLEGDAVKAFLAASDKAIDDYDGPPLPRSF